MEQHGLKTMIDLINIVPTTCILDQTVKPLTFKHITDFSGKLHRCFWLLKKLNSLSQPCLVLPSKYE